MLRVAALAAAKSGTPPCYGLHLLRQTCTAWQLIPAAEGQSGATTSALHTMSSFGSDHRSAFSCLSQAGPSFGTSYCNLHIVRGVGSPAAAQVCILSAWTSQRHLMTVLSHRGRSQHPIPPMAVLLLVSMSILYCRSCNAHSISLLFAFCCISVLMMLLTVRCKP